MSVLVGERSRSSLEYIPGSTGDSEPLRLWIVGGGATVSEPLDPVWSSPLLVNSLCLSLRPRFSLLLPLPLQLSDPIILRCQLLLA